MDIQNDWLYYCATKLDIGASLLKALEVVKLAKQLQKKKIVVSFVRSRSFQRTG